MAKTHKDAKPTLEELADIIMQNLADNNLDKKLGTPHAKQALIDAVARGEVDTALTGDKLSKEIDRILK